MELNQYPLRIEITNKCNLKCDYCLSLTSSYYRNRPETNFAALKKFIKFLRIKSLLLLGGEVCYYHKINGLADYCFKNNISVGIITNGVLLDRYKEISAINKRIIYIVSYNKEGCLDRLKMCDRFIKEMNARVINILINEGNENNVVGQVKKFQKMKKIKLIKIFSNEQTKKGRYNSLFESLVSKYDKVYIHDYCLKKDSTEKIKSSRRDKIRCNNPLSLKGDNISFCKNIEDFGMKTTEIDFSKKENKDMLKAKFNKFQKRINLGQVEGCKRCRFKNYWTKNDTILEWVVSNINLYNLPMN